MAMAVYDLPGGGKVWAGQADDPFFVDLGALWDLGQLRTITGDNGGVGIDTLAGYNAQAIALQVPITSVTSDGMMPNDPSGRERGHRHLGGQLPPGDRRRCARRSSARTPTNRRTSKATSPATAAPGSRSRASA